MSTALPECQVHCWHTRDHVMYTSNPPRVTYVCCHCGLTQVTEMAITVPEGHGPHYPNNGSAWPTYTTGSFNTYTLIPVQT